MRQKYCKLRVFDIYLLIHRIHACVVGSTEEKHRGIVCHETMHGSEEGKGDGVRSHRNHNRTRPRLVRLYTVHYGKSRRLRGCVSKTGYSFQVSTVDQGSSLRTSNLVPYLQYVAKPKILPSQHQLAWPRPAVTQYKGAIARSFASFLSLLRPRWLFRPILDFICLIPSLVPPPQLTYHLPSQLIFVPLFLLSSYPLLSIGLSRLLFTLHSWCYPPSRSTNFPINNQKRNTQNVRAR